MLTVYHRNTVTVQSSDKRELRTTRRSHLILLTITRPTLHLLVHSRVHLDPFRFTHLVVIFSHDARAGWQDTLWSGGAPTSCDESPRRWRESGRSTAATPRGESPSARLPRPRTFAQVHVYARGRFVERLVTLNENLHKRNSVRLIDG